MSTPPHLSNAESCSLPLRLTPQKPSPAPSGSPSSHRRTSSGTWKRQLPEDSHDDPDRPAKRYSPSIAEPERPRSLYFDPANGTYSAPSGRTTPVVMVYTPTGSAGASRATTEQLDESDVAMGDSSDSEAGGGRSREVEVKDEPMDEPVEKMEVDDVATGWTESDRQAMPGYGPSGSRKSKALDAPSQAEGRPSDSHSASEESVDKPTTVSGPLFGDASAGKPPVGDDALPNNPSAPAMDPATSMVGADRNPKKSNPQQSHNIREPRIKREDSPTNSSEAGGRNIKSEHPQTSQLPTRSPVNEMSEVTKAVTVKAEEDDGMKMDSHAFQNPLPKDGPSNGPTAQPKTGDTIHHAEPPPASASHSAAAASHPQRPAKKKTFAETFRDATQPQKMVWWTRWTIQKLHKKIMKEGPGAFTPADFTNIKQKLVQLSYYDFKKERQFYEDSQINKAVKILMDSKNYGDNMADMAKELCNRWESGNLGIAPLNSVKFEDVDESESESDVDLNDGAAGTGRVGIQQLSLPARQLMTGIKITRSERGHITQRIDPNYREKKDAGVFGHNGLTIGQWWPYQICALRDGAHGARQGGIYGRELVGAISIVTTSDSKYSDRDEGDILYYSGSHDDPVHNDDTAPQLTKNTRLLLKSIHTGKPVRVIRKGPSKKNTYYPRSGYRYDGLYRVRDYEIRSGKSGQRDYYRFELSRCPGQVPLTDPSVTGRPTRSEYELFLELTGRRYA